MISKLIAKSRTTEVSATTSRLVGAFQKTSLNSDAHLAGIFTSLENESALFSSAIKRMKAESDLEEADEKRDQSDRGLYYLVLGFTHHPDATIKAAAEKIYAVLENYGLSMLSDSYATESSLINSMLGDLAKPALQDSIAALSGCAELIATVKADQENFEAARITWEEEKAEEGTQDNATAIKKRVIALVNDQLVVYLRAMEQVDVETYGAFARTVAEIIADNNETVKKRRKVVAPM